MSFRLDLDKIDRRRLVPGLILIGIGILGLFSTLGWFGGLGGLAGAVLFGAGAYFAHLQARQTGARAWRLAVYPLAGLAIAAIAPGSLGGFAFLGSLGLAFALVYREDADQWWAVIPAGALLSLAATALVDGMARGGAGGSVFLFGLASTFFVLSRLPRHAQGWAIYPAAVLALLAVVALTSGGGWTVPLLLIAVGGWLLLRPDERSTAAAPDHSEASSATEAPIATAEPAAADAPTAAIPGPAAPTATDEDRQR